jgi:uncharacterized membrane protein YfcA
MREGIIAVCIGSLAGALGGLFGIGGGILIVPALIFSLGFSQHKAQGTSLVALLAPVGILALYDYYKKGDVDFKVGLLIAFGFLFGALFGSRLSLALDENVLRKSFAVFLLCTAIWLFVGKR